MLYPAFVHKDSDVTGFMVTFPDFPNCTAIGASIEEVTEKAEEALNLHIENMIEEGTRIPQPSSAKSKKVLDGSREADVQCVIDVKAKPRTMT